MKRLFVFLIIASIPYLSYPEGTKQILLSDDGHGKIQVMPSFNPFAWYTSSGVSADPEYRLHIHIANIGEKIYYGFGDVLNHQNVVVTDVVYRIKDPSGNIVVGPAPVPSSFAGYITTFAQAVAGPSAIVGPTGYIAVQYSPAMTGDYFIEFNFNNGFGGHDRTKFKYFDITVASATNQAIDGRVWSKAWQMTADDQAPPPGVYAFWGKLFAYSDDGIVTSVSFNGMEPFVFTVSCNPWGCYNTGNFTLDRRSVSGNHTLTQYKVFLNDPDVNVYPTGILGSVVPPINIIPNCNGTATIMINVTKEGNVDIILDINPAPGIQPEDVELAAAVVTGVNSIPWNGLNGLGQQVLNLTTFNVTVTYINGLTNLPIYDVEQNPSGFVIELHRPVGPIPPVFWDDILVGGSQNFTGCTSVPPSTGCHIFSGNNNTMNTWWYAVTSVSAPVLFTELRQPNQPGSITGTASLCPGSSNIIYWINREANSTGYIWGYTGIGAVITGVNDTTVSVTYVPYATSGDLTVSGTNAQCGAGPPRTKAITILPPPAVSLSSFTPVCIDDPPFTLSGGFPAGGTYWLAGNQVTTFNPAVAGLGTHIITYIYTDPGTGCTGQDTSSITVVPLPVVTLSALPSICIDAAPITLSQGTPPGGTYSGPGITGGNLFDPSIAGIGSHLIIYTYTSVYGCTNTASNTIIVFQLPTVTLAPFQPVCLNTPPFLLTGGSPSGGTYTGTGVTANMFNPGTAGIGTHVITYTYTDGNGCTNSNSGTITVGWVPEPPGIITGNDTICQEAMLVGYSITPVPNATSYAWSVVPSGACTFSGNWASVTANWSPTFTGTGLIFVAGINECGQGSNGNPITVMVHPKPVMSFAKCIDTVTTSLAQPITLKGGIPLGGSYSGPGVNSSQGIFYTALAGTGNRIINYSYTNFFGCTASISRAISVSNPVPWNCGSVLSDIRDNRQYSTILIGTQCWMAENLNYGMRINSMQYQRDNCIIEKYCFNDDPAYCTSYGGLYQWDEVMAYSDTQGKQGLCPPGWHIPVEPEWTILFSNYFNSGFAGSPLKATGYSGFDAILPGVSFYSANFNFFSFATFFWSSESPSPEKAWSHGMNDPDPSVSLYASSKSNAYSMRCIKD